MSDEESLAVEVSKALSVLPEAYRDLLQPAARQLGQGLLLVARAVNVALAPLSATVWGFERIRDWLFATLTRKLSRVPPEQIQTPSRLVAGQVLLNLEFVLEEELLREMYTNLLAASMDGRSAEKAHPAYVSILQQISSDEARILKYLAEQPPKLLYWSDHYPSSDRRAVSLSEQWAKLCELAGVVHPDSTSTYQDNLVRLRILSINVIGTARLIHRHGVSEFAIMDDEVSLEEGTLQELFITDLGGRFLDTCVREK